jgi:hypothetical protein
MRKYKFTSVTKVEFGITLKQIEAAVSFGSIVKGQVGGWVEKEGNLNQSGNAWVYGDAQAYGDAQVSGYARVYGNARVSGNAQAYGNARVHDDAWVYGDAWVSGDARVSGNAWVSGNARVVVTVINLIAACRFSVSAYKGKDGDLIQVGCRSHTVKEWKKIPKKILISGCGSKAEYLKCKAAFDYCVKLLKQQ